MLRKIHTLYVALYLGYVLALPSSGHAVTEVNVYGVADKGAYECVVRILQRPARTVSVKFDYSERYDPEAAHPELHLKGLAFPPLPFITYSYRTNRDGVLTAKLFVTVGDARELELGFNGTDRHGVRITPLRTSDENPYFELTHELWSDCHAIYSGDVPGVTAIRAVPAKPRPSK